MAMSNDVGVDVEAYRRDGYAVVRGLFSADEAATMRAEGHATVARLAERYDVDGTWSTARDPAGNATALSHCHDMQLHAAAFAQRLFDPRLTAAFAATMDTPNVQLHHNKLFIKPPENGSPFPLHQDWPFFPHANDSLVAAIVHLDDAPEEKGCLRVVPGSHRSGRQDHIGEPHWNLAATNLDDEAITLPAAAGDVLFFSCLTIHGSGVNVSSEPRTTWLVQVRDPADSPTVDRHRSPGQGTMLAGINAANPAPPSSFQPPLPRRVVR